MQIVSTGHNVQNLFSGKNKKNISICCLLKLLYSECLVLRVTPMISEANISMGDRFL